MLTGLSDEATTVHGVHKVTLHLLHYKSKERLQRNIGYIVKQTSQEMLGCHLKAKMKV